MVMVEFQGMQIGCCLVPIVTWPINPSLPIKDVWAFFSQVSQFFSGYIIFVCLMINRSHSIIMIFCNLSIVVQTKLRKQEWINSYWTLKGVKTFFPIFVSKTLYVSHIMFHLIIPGSLVWFFFSRTLLGSSIIRKPTFGTFNPIKLTSNSIYFFMDSCPSFAAVKLNKMGPSYFSPIGVSILGSRCSLKWEYQINDTLLPESNKDVIWIPILAMLILGHFATACCIVLTLPCAKIPWLDIDLKTLSIKSLCCGPLLVPPLPWSLDKGVSSLPFSSL